MASCFFAPALWKQARLFACITLLCHRCTIIGLFLHVALEVSGISGNEMEFEVPSSWGDVTKLGNAISNLKSETPGTVIADTVDSDSRILRGIHRGKAHLSYELTKDWDGPLRNSVRHRAQLEPSFLEINTSNALIHPKLESLSPVECTFDWKLPARWVLATSFGTGKSLQKFKGAWNSVQHATFAAGDFRLYPARMGKGALVIAIRGEWGQPDTEIASQLTQIIVSEQKFWNDNDFPYFLVTVFPFGAGGGSGGSAFTNAFDLYVSPKDSFRAPSILSLVAHEVFHTWNPYKLGRMPSDSRSVTWFTEGFTTYYQDLLLLRAGLILFEDYLRPLNRIFRDYFQSPAKNVALRAVIDSPPQDQVTRQIAYERGAATALWLDSKIRQNSQGKSSLDTLMLDLFREAQRQKRQLPELTRERIFRAVSRYVNSEELDQLRAYVEQGITIDTPNEIFGCAKREMTELVSFDLGMDREALVERHLVTGLRQGSAAQDAGLKDGDKVIGTSVNWNDVSKPVKLTIRRGDATSKIEYYPRGKSLGFMPQYVPNGTACRY